MASTPSSLLDRLVVNFDRGLRTVFGGALTTGRPNPSGDVQEPHLSEAERQHAAGLMRVNHAGEVAAQALYHGQALTARRGELRDLLDQAALEENDHLAWCEDRLKQLGSRTSYLAPFWYAGSFAIGALAGVAGDRWSLGFLAETEHQVVRHLDGHLAELPQGDERSRTIVTQMRDDESHHATTALRAGGVDLPPPVKDLMEAVSKVMTRTAYWL